MNPHDDMQEHARDEEQIAPILAAAQTDAAPVDPDLLARLRAQSTDAFASAGESKRPALFRRARWLAAAAAVVIGVGLYFWLAPGASALTLGQVLDKLEKAETLHLRFSQEGKQIEFWHTSQPNRSRWDELDGNYRIADGTNLWAVNEKANEARRTKQPPKELRSAEQFLDLLRVGEFDRPNVLAARPVERTHEEDFDVLIYRTEFFVRKMEKVQLEARVVAKTKRLLSIRTWFEKPGKIEPFAELTVLAYDEPIGAEKFVIADTLTEDGRIGKVTDVQGIVTIKPVLHERWTPVRENLVLKPGDWVRTDARGANATALRLAKQTGVILGPKTLVELIGPKQIRVIEGEIEITPFTGTTIELLGPMLQKVNVKGKQFYRVEKEQLAQVAKDPPWLLGFKGVTANEALGALIAMVDGRNVPLTIGYHKVAVDIRDQIARTVIEESFVNNTGTQLEGVFYFPLPPDASISGFGMWIGDNLVEADVVEKQRAREIYETFVRERRDPGLLEWSGGNIFKARVFPIPARSEKRIKITYTQVLPLKGSRYRYSYGLQSELLQQHPLRALSIDLKVHSAVPLKSVTSPTHPTRADRTTHSAHVEFSAQEYTPTRDFEVVIETAGRPQPVVLIPHRRGDDGYLMLQLTPPGANGDWDRPILPDGDPLQLLILADTSASIDATQRATQATFIGSLLAALAPKDTFNLAACDVTCDWTFTKPASADAKNVSAARDFLAQRASLGWTDLDAAFASALKQCGPNTHVLYVGDGIVTGQTAGSRQQAAGSGNDADPIAFAQRLRKLYQGKGTFHAVTLGSSYESTVLKAIAALGSGSMRKITSEQGPTLVARELLGEIAQPALRDLKVEFKGIKAARIYPESLANIPAGAQQILMGRYLPEGKDQTGEVIVTGTQGGKPLRFSIPAALKDAEQGNSFIPRLWARMHLDSLLEQGSSDTIKDEIIALSEEFQIITPYTSLLVLETDADRERFKVKRRFQMRDGERFFADGRDNAVFDLRQKQMKKASHWRTALRRSVLSELARLGREPNFFRPTPNGKYKHKLALWDMTHQEMDLWSPDGLAETSALGRGSDLGWMPLGSVNGENSVELLEGRGVNELLGDLQDDAEKQRGFVNPFGVDQARVLNRVEPLPEPGNFNLNQLDFDGELPAFFARDRWGTTGGDERLLSDHRGPHYSQWLNTLFPPLYAAPRKPKEPKSTWPAPARELVKSLLRNEQLTKLTGGIEIVRKTEQFDERWGDVTARSRRLELVSAQSWLTRSESDGGQTLVSWCDAKEVGIFSKAFQLGRLRASTPLDVQTPPLELADYSLASLERDFATYAPTLEVQGKDRTLLVVKNESSPRYDMHVLIDTARHVILSIEHRDKGKVTSSTRFDDFVEAGGVWWAQKIETSDDKGKRLSLVTQTVKTLALNEFDKQIKLELASRAQVQFLRLPMPSVAAAKKALVGAKTSFDDRFVLLLHFHRSQQWPRVLDQLQQAETLAVGKPGLRWLRSAVLYDSRRHDDLRKRYQDDAARLAKTPSADAYFLAEHIVGQSASVLQANEMLALLDTLQPLYEKQPALVQARKRWQSLRVSYLGQTGRTDEALRLQKQLATDYPRDYSLQQQYAQALANGGDYPAAYAWLTRVLVKEAKWDRYREEALRNTYTELLQRQGRYADLVTYLAGWMEQNPAGRSVYEQYLSALIKSDQIEKAEKLALQWLKDAQAPDELSPSAQGRLDAALNLMLGHGYQLYTNRVEERWLAPLAQAALFFARHEAHAGAAGQILWANTPFSRTEEARKVRKILAGILSAEIDKLPAAQLLPLIDWVHFEDAEPAAWDKIRAKLRQRWTNEAKAEVKHLLGMALIQVLARQNQPNDLLSFLRVQWQTGPEKHRTAYVNQLFDRLLKQPWSAQIETETFTLFDKLSTAEEPDARLFTSVAALHRLTDRLLEARIAVATKALEHPEKLTRTELRTKQDEIIRTARIGLADRLRKEATKHPKALGPWLVAESLYLDVLLDRNLKQAAAEAWEFLGAAPKKDADEPTIDRALDDLLRQRSLITLSNLAARKGAEPALIERLLKYLDQGIRVDLEDGRWKLAKYRLLIALDRSKELEQTLRQWTRQDDSDNRWRVALGYVLAEQGRLPEAIQQFEAVERADELDPSAYRALADWYLVQDQRDGHERAAAAVYKTMPEYRLSQMIGYKLQPWHRRDGHLPTELDKEVVRMFAVLFDKSVAPQNYLNQLQQFYQACHDFRLLAGLPDALVGHSAARVYPFVQGMRSILDEVRDEATADEIVKRIAEVRPRAKTDIDQRALDLLEVQVERRAAEVHNQPGPHREKALTALVRASKRAWSPGEPRLMADFLASLGKITQPALAEEQLRQLKGLHAEAAAGSIDRLHIAHRYAMTLQSYERRADAIDRLQAALDEFQAANDGVLPVVANGPFAALISLLEGAGHYARAEQKLLAQLAHPVHAQQRRWLTEQLGRSYLHALQNGGEVSLGKDLTLYKALNAKLQKDLAETDENHRYELIAILTQLYGAAHEKKLPGVVADLKTFAFQVVPPLLKQQTNHHETIVTIVAQAVHDLAGPRDGIAFLLERIEGEPRWLAYNNQDGWNRHGNTLADWRKQAKDLGEVEGRLLKLVLKELRRDLETREPRTRPMYHRQADRDRYWAEKAADFAKTAEDVLAQRSKSGAAVQYIADYFYWGLGQPNRAIEILFNAHNQKLLDDEGQAKLVYYLQRENRYGESIAVLQPLVERRPENLEYRVQLMHAYFRTMRKMELLALLKQSDAFFHEKDRWGEHPLSRLAQSTLQNDLFEQSVAYFKELIPLHERTQPNRGIGNGTLSGYYIGLARAYAGLQKTAEAVDAAGGAIVAWGSQHGQRASALRVDHQVARRPHQEHQARQNRQNNRQSEH